MAKARELKPSSSKRPLYLRAGDSLSKSISFYQRGGYDSVFVCLVIILFTYGITMLGSASYAYSAYTDKNGDPLAIFKEQLFMSALGFVGMYLISKMDYRILNGRLAIVAFAAAVVVMAATILMGIIKGSDTYRWISIGRISVQPSEFAKMAMIIVFAYLLTALKEPLLASKEKPAPYRPKADGYSKIERRIFRNLRTSGKSMLFLLCVLAIFCCLVVCQKHFSATILFCLLGYFMIMLSGTKKEYFLLLLAIAAVAILIVLINPNIIKGVGFGTDRIIVWLDKANPDYIDKRRQTMNGLYAIGSGGFFGVGFGRSVQKQLYISELHNDFVFPVLCEELGFLGATAMILLFAALIYRGFKIAKESTDYFGSLLVMGVMIQIALQVIINIAVVTDLFPNTGMVLPFFSSGGSSIISILCEMGLVISVSRRSRIEKL